MGAEPIAKRDDSVAEARGPFNDGRPRSWNLAELKAEKARCFAQVQKSANSNFILQSKAWTIGPND